MKVIVTLHKNGIELTNVVVDPVKPGDLPIAFKQFIERAQIVYGEDLCGCQISICEGHAGATVASSHRHIGTP